MFDFATALVHLKAGKCVQRIAWITAQGDNVEPCFLYFVNGSKFPVNRPPLSELLTIGTEVVYHGHIDRLRVVSDNSGKVHVEANVWDANQEDILADDWMETL